MTNKLLMIAIYAVPTALLLVGAYLFTKKKIIRELFIIF